MFGKKRGKEPDPGELVSVASFSEHQRMDADLVKSRLDAAGVRSVVLEENSMKMALGAPGIGRIRVKVRYADLPRARAALNIF
jgi:hypothetical protein